jgi:hypothetical protein
MFWSRRFSVLLLILGASQLLCVHADDEPQRPYQKIDNKKGQRSVAIQWVQLEARAKAEIAVQFTKDGHLLLTPDECFFKNLKAIGKRSKEGIPKAVLALNQNKSFKSISGWQRASVAKWYLYFNQPGSITLFLSKSHPIPLIIEIAGQRKEYKSRPISFNIPARGQYKLSMQLKKASSARQLKVDFIDVYGGAANKAGVIRSRWRPSAAHAKFTSSTFEGSSKLWVFELDAAPGEQGFYCPITTPFGYFGCSWTAQGYPKGGINFSMWSFGRGKKSPPVHKLSHLIAIGHREARFDGFKHEGTGVKVRGWEPFKGRREQRQAFAIRLEPGSPYNCYFGYFYDSQREAWRLFAAGKKFNKKKNTRPMRLGSFVEVPGRAEKQRTGDLVRCMRYRGWLMDAKGEWHVLDRLSKEKKKSNYLRGVASDGRFFMQIGGIDHYNGNEAVKLTGKKRALPGFLDSKVTGALLTVPSRLVIHSVLRSGAGVELQFKVSHPGKNPQAIVYYGASDSLTFAKRWAHNKTVAGLSEGINKVTIKGAADQFVYFRMLLRSELGQYWSTETFRRK